MNPLYDPGITLILGILEVNFTEKHLSISWDAENSFFDWKTYS